ncbi:MAG: type II toxin-antitoxin system RelE family toxin [Candidatus Nanoarchaeia archaeon]
MFEIEFVAETKKFLKKIPLKDKKRIIASIERCRIRPFPHVKKLVGCPYFRLRVGKYRIILDIQSKKLIILVLEIGHRRNIYKNN